MASAPAWTPIAILPNISLSHPVDGDAMVLASVYDPRAAAICEAVPNLRELLSRFTNAFGSQLIPSILLAQTELVPKLERTQAFQSFRDLIVASTIPFSRALNLVYGERNRVVYSDSFWLYPWMLSKDDTHIIGSTPAILAYQVVDEFAGQCSPEVPHIELSSSEFDNPLFDALLARWNNYYLGKRQSFSELALFRSLNMANHAAQIPSGVDVTLWDFGRIAALWISAFEILAHPHTTDCSQKDVYRLFNSVRYHDSKFRRRRFLLYRRNGNQRRGLHMHVGYMKNFTVPVVISYTAIPLTKTHSSQEE